MVNHAPSFLVLDDDPDTRLLTRRKLERAFTGARVFEAATPDEAVAMAGGVTLDGVITDHHLGTAEGASIVQGLRVAGAQCPVVMVTASSDPMVFRRAYNAGAARVFAGYDFDFIGYFRTVLATAK